MESTTNLASLPEESLEQQHSHSPQQQQQDSQKMKPLPSSAFASVPDRPPIQLSFAMLACKIKEKARVVAMDMRGHGKSSTDNDLDLSVETMCSDVFAVVKAMYGDSPPAIVLVGHSMGGSVAVHVAGKHYVAWLGLLLWMLLREQLSLIHMQKILSSRMQQFSSIEKALKQLPNLHHFDWVTIEIECSVKGGSLGNTNSAHISIPSTLKFDE